MTVARAGRAGRRVTHVVWDLHAGGLESLVAALARRFAASGTVRTSVVTLSGREGRIGERIRPALEEIRVARMIPRLSMLRPAGLAREIRLTRADVVHLHSGSWYKGVRAARLAGVPRVIYTEHGREHHDPVFGRWLDRLASRRTDVVVAVSERLRRYLASVVGVDEQRIVTIVNGVDTELFQPGPPPEDLRSRLDIPQEAAVVGSVGRFDPVKDYGRLIEAVGLIRREGRLNRPIALVLCGDGPERAALTAWVAELGLSDIVRLPGWTDTPEAYYRLFDVFGLSSVMEGASVSLLEAMASGTAPVVTDVGANAALLGPRLASQVVPPGDINALVEVLSATLASPERRRAVGAESRRRVVAEYGLDRMADRYEEFYLS
jgi:glycosyltransferase involved in cell wall biosynthesis